MKLSTPTKGELVQQIKRQEAAIARLEGAVRAALPFMTEFAAAGNRYAPATVRRMRAALKSLSVHVGDTSRG